MGIALSQVRPEHAAEMVNLRASCIPGLGETLWKQATYACGLQNFGIQKCAAIGAAGKGVRKTYDARE